MKQHLEYKTMALCQENNDNFLEICKKILTPKASFCIPGYVVINHSMCNADGNACKNDGDCCCNTKKEISNKL